MLEEKRIPRNGLSIRELSQRIGRSPATVARYTSESRDNYEARAVARHERIRELRANGLSYRAIAAELDVSIGTVHYALNKHKTAA